MATTVLSNKQQPVAGNILAAFLPQRKGTSTQTDSSMQKTDLSPDAMNAIIRSMMEGDTGLAALLQNQMKNGLYNSSTAGLLANDLAARVSEKAALASAPTTKTATQTTKAPIQGTIDPKWALGLQLASELLGRGNKGGSSNSNSGGLLDTIASIFSGNSKKNNSNDNFNGNAFQDTSNFQTALSDQNNVQFSLPDFSPSAMPNLGGGNNGFSYDPSTFASDNLWMNGTGFSGNTLSSIDFNQYVPSSGFSFGNGGLSFGFNF